MTTVHKKHFSIVSFVLLLLLIPLVVLAADSDLDPTFGSGGIVTTNFPTAGIDEGRAVALQADGKIVAAGSAYTGAATGSDFALARYNSDGSLDATFGAEGLVTTDVGGSQEVARSVAVQGDGQIVIAGWSDSQLDFILARYNSNGSLDTTFGAGGIVITDIGSGAPDSANALAIQADGKILVAGDALGTGGYNFALARFNSNGSPDLTFGSGGIATTDIGANEGAYALAVQNDGKIILAGGGPQVSSPLEDFALARYNSDGSLDATFGAGGIVNTDFLGNFDTAYALAIQADGKIVAAGTTTGTSIDLALARYNSDGSLDTGFGTGGRVVSDLSGDGSGSETGRAMAVAASGKILVAGQIDVDPGTGGGEDVLLTRYNSNGSLDTSFDTDGFVATGIGGVYDDGQGVVIQADGRIIVAGTASGDFALVRYNGSPPSGLSISPENILQVPGTGASLTVNVSGVSDLYAYQFDVLYDDSLVTPTISFVDTFFDTSTDAYAAAPCDAGTCSIIATKLDPGLPVSGDGPLLTIDLLPVPGAGGEFELDISNVTLATLDGDPIPTSPPASTVTVTTIGAATVDGVVSLQGRATPGTAGTVTLSDSGGTYGPFTTSFDATTGAFSFSDVPFHPGTGTEYTIQATHDLYLGNELVHTLISTSYTTADTRLLGGDANLSGDVSMADITCIAGNFGAGAFACGGTGSSNINADAVTNIQDLAISGGNFSKASFLPW